MTSAVTNRQSMAIVIATLIQDDFSSNRPHLLCVSTARRSFRGLRTDGPLFRADPATAPTLTKKVRSF
jgi:hypothetical protein